MEIPKVIKLQGACNLRDLGGYKGAGGRRVALGRLYRSDQLSGLGTEDLAVLERLGLRTVVDYRLPKEYSKAPVDRWPALKQVVHLVPTSAAVEIAVAASNDHEKVAALLQQSYVQDNLINGSGLVMMEQNRDFVRSPEVATVYRHLLNLLLAPASQPLVQMCRGGKDRTGFGSALILQLLGVPRETIVADYVLTDRLRQQRNHRRMAQYLKETDDPRVLAYLRSMMEARPEYLLAAFGEMEHLYGSVTGYLKVVLKVTLQEQKELQRLYLE